MTKEKLIIDVCKTHTCPLYLFEGDRLFFSPECNPTGYSILPQEAVPARLASMNQLEPMSNTLDFHSENNDEISTCFDRQDFPLFFLSSTNRTRNYTIFTGPLSSTYVDFPTWHDFCKKNRIKCSSDYKVKVVNPSILTGLLTVLHELMSDCAVTLAGSSPGDFFQPVSDMDTAKKGVDLWAPGGQIHTSYQLEKDLMNSIGEGDLEETLRVASFFDRARVGRMSENSLKQEEYMAVIGMTLFTRAVIEQGVPSEKAYSISDRYLRKISASRDISEINRLSYSALQEFVQELQGVKKEGVSSVHVSKARDYINRHLQSRLSLQEIADAVNISSSHLSSLFRTYEGVSVRQYVMAKKLEAAESMLRFSDYGIETISEYFHFASSSHFGTAFRKQYHCSPSEYRKKYNSQTYSDDDESGDESLLH